MLRKSLVACQQIVGRGDGAVDNRDAKVLLAGLSFEFGASPMHPRELAQVAAAGPVSNHGCPVYEKVVIKPNKLELKEKLQFALDSPRIEPASHPSLDEVVRALQDNRNFRVVLEGHASSEGRDEHNQKLSEHRARAVLEYLVSHGVHRTRLASKGFSSSVPIDTNTTAAGRENNCRVEFDVSFIILNPGSGK